MLGLAECCVEVLAENVIRPDILKGLPVHMTDRVLELVLEAKDASLALRLWCSMQVPIVTLRLRLCALEERLVRALALFSHSLKSVVFDGVVLPLNTRATGKLLAKLELEHVEFRNCPLLSDDLLQTLFCRSGPLSSAKCLVLRDCPFASGATLGIPVHVY